MMTMSTRMLPTSQQALIDSRLDTIDRMLTGRVPRSDRLVIVREVESQIYELLSNHEPSTVTREDVLDVLRRLDPPEAYLPEETNDEMRSRSQSAPYVTNAQKTNLPSAGRFDGRIGGVFGLISFAMLFAEAFLIILAQGGKGEPSMFLFAAISAPFFLGFSSGIFGFVFSIRGRQQGAWPIVGLVFSAMSLPVWIFSTAFLFLQML